jgi:uncharacterized protein YndB with AHSA1/START domain
MAGSNAGPSGASDAADRDLVVMRIFDASRDLVFKAWTEAERLARWWGPNGFTMLACNIDLRIGGAFHYGMRAPNGHEMWGKWVFREIVAPERLVFIVSFTDKEGNPIRNPFAADWPLEVLSTLTLTEYEGRTTLTMQGAPLNATELERKAFEAGYASMRQGWAGTLDQLAEELANR